MVKEYKIKQIRELMFNKKSDFAKNFQTGSKSQQFELGSGVYEMVLNES